METALCSGNSWWQRLCSKYHRSCNPHCRSVVVIQASEAVLVIKKPLGRSAVHLLRRLSPLHHSFTVIAIADPTHDVPTHAAHILLSSPPNATHHGVHLASKQIQTGLVGDGNPLQTGHAGAAKVGRNVARIHMRKAALGDVFFDGHGMRSHRELGARRICSRRSLFVRHVVDVVCAPPAIARSAKRYAVSWFCRQTGEVCLLQPT